MNRQEFEKIKTRLVKLVQSEDRLEHEWNTRLYRGYLYFVGENAYFVNAYLPLAALKSSFVEICPGAEIPDDQDLGTADPERTEMTTLGQDLLLQQFQASDVIPDMVRFFTLMDSRERELILSLIYVFHLVEDTLRKYSESFTVQSDWGYGEYDLRELFLGVLAGLDSTQDVKQNWEIIEGIYPKVEEFRFILEPWMEYVS